MQVCIESLSQTFTIFHVVVYRVTTFTTYLREHVLSLLSDTGQSAENSLANHRASVLLREVRLQLLRFHDFGSN